jgi:hypothetical protein
MPQGFTSFASVALAIPETSATRLVCVNVGAAGADADWRLGAIAITTADAARTIVSVFVLRGEMPRFPKELR